MQQFKQLLVTLQHTLLQGNLEQTITELVFDSSYSDGQHRKTADNSKLLDFLPNFEFTPIERGLKETIKWFINNYEISRK